jgi:hypothetical protein
VSYAHATVENKLTYSSLIEVGSIDDVGSIDGGVSSLRRPRHDEVALGGGHPAAAEVTKGWDMRIIDVDAHFGEPKDWLKTVDAGLAAEFPDSIT